MDSGKYTIALEIAAKKKEIATQFLKKAFYFADGALCIY